MFDNCVNLKELDFSKWKFDELCNHHNIIENCGALENIKLRHYNEYSEIDIAIISDFFKNITEYIPSLTGLLPIAKDYDADNDIYHDIRIELWGKFGFGEFNTLKDKIDFMNHFEKVWQ